MKKEMEDKDNLQPYGLSQKDLLKAITFVDKNVESKSFAQGLKENFEGLQAWASSSKLSQKAKKALLTCTVASMLLSSCKQVIPTIDIQTEPIPIVETAVFTETAEPTPVPTLFPKLKVTETSPNAGGSYSEEQLTVIDSEGFKEKVSVINNWWSYWGNAAENQRPFHPKSKNVHIVPFFDEENSESYSLAIEAKMDDGNWHTFLLPIDISKAEFRQYPPVEFGPNGIPLKTGYDIPEGFGPLEVTGDIKWTESFGWVRFDEFGKMVEFINMETGQWKKMESVIFSEKYPVTWHEGYIAKVGEMEIPIDIGLHYKIRLRTEEPISEIHIAPDMVDGVGDYFMHMCFWRYTQLMDHPDVTYEQYLELVAKGEGKVEILTYDEDKPDQEYSEKNLIDPRKGFSFVWAGVVLPMGPNGAYYFGSSKEKILLILYGPVSDFVMIKAHGFSETVSANLYFGGGLVAILSRVGTLRFEHGYSITPSKFREWQHSYLRLEMDKYQFGSRLDPPFSVLQP